MHFPTIMVLFACTAWVPAVLAQQKFELFHLSADVSGCKSGSGQFDGINEFSAALAGMRLPPRAGRSARDVAVFQPAPAHVQNGALIADQPGRRKAHGIIQRFPATRSGFPFSAIFDYDRCTVNTNTPDMGILNNANTDVDAGKAGIRFWF